MLIVLQYKYNLLIKTRKKLFGLNRGWNKVKEGKFQMSQHQQKKRHSFVLTLMIIAAIVFTTIVFTSCESMTWTSETTPETTTETTPETTPETVENEEKLTAEEYYKEAIREYEQNVSYEESIMYASRNDASDYEGDYKSSIEEQLKKTLLRDELIRDDEYGRLSIAKMEDIPEEMLTLIAQKDPDSVVRFRALGNILSRKEFSVTSLRHLATSYYEITRLIATMHSNSDYKVVSALVEDPDELVRQQAVAKLAEVEKSEGYIPTITWSVKEDEDFGSVETKEGIIFSCQPDCYFCLEAGKMVLDSKIESKQATELTCNYKIIGYELYDKESSSYYDGIYKLRSFVDNLSESSINFKNESLFDKIKVFVQGEDGKIYSAEILIDPHELW